MKGSEITKEQMLIKSEMIFDSFNSIPRIMKAVHNKIDRMAWDKDIEGAEVLRVINDKIILWY